MGDESEVVHSSGLLNRYMKIPSSLENVTLADWAALYDSPQKPFVKKSKDINKDNLPLERADDEENDDELPDCANEAMQNTKQPKPKQCLKPILEFHIRSVWLNVKPHPKKNTTVNFLLQQPFISGVSPSFKRQNR